MSMQHATITKIGRGYKKASDEAVKAAYAKAGSAKGASELLGMCKQSVHERLARLGVCMNADKFTDGDDARIVAEYEAHADTGRLAVLAQSMGRTKSSLARRARHLGLTDRNRKKPYLSEGSSERQKAHLKEHGHPRGALGLVHSESARKAISASSKRNWSTWKAFGTGPMSEEGLRANSNRSLSRATHISSENCYSRAKRGKRADLGDVFFRSKWEANYARYLNLLVQMKVVETWGYEPETFVFDGGPVGCRSYRPDFIVKRRNVAAPVYVEVKGWMDAKSKKKLALFKKHFPQHRLELVGEKEYDALTREWSSSIHGWEK